ncbi:MAG TPA: glutaredoxin family protein [Burkholderiales bacterium]|nr:glutaredoxin family protein [Burkholderiales bacterium]
MIARSTLLTAALALAASAASAQIYRWTDDNGKVHITDTPPPAGAKNVKKQRPAGAPAAEGENDPFVLQQARKKAPVTLYSAPSCGEPCSIARKLLNERGVPFKEVSVVEEAQFEELTKAVGGGGVVPSLVVGASTLQGFQASTYHAMLDAAGYPKTGVLAPRAQQEPKAPAPQTEPTPQAEAAPTGPYAPGARPQRPPRKPAP